MLTPAVRERLALHRPPQRCEYRLAEPDPKRTRRASVAVTPPGTHAHTWTFWDTQPILVVPLLTGRAGTNVFAVDCSRRVVSPYQAPVTSGPPHVLVFDVNETLLDIDALAGYFAQIFEDAAVLRTWFAELVLYSMTLTLAGYYADFFALGRATLQMIAATRGRQIGDAELSTLEEAMRTMPAHPDAATGLQRLQENGFRLVTLTNSPHRSDSGSPLDNAGLTRHFERQFSVDTFKVFKPATHLYRRVAADLGVDTESCMMVAAHSWDLIGARSAGMRTALITRPGNAALIAEGVPHPDLIVDNVVDLADQLTATP